MISIVSIIRKENERFIKGCVRNEIHIVIRYIGKTVLLYLIKGVTYVYYRWRLDSSYVN